MKKVLFFLMSTLGLLLHAQEWQVVAREDMSDANTRQFYAPIATSYCFSIKEAPVHPKLPANSPLRHVLFGQNLEFTYTGVNPQTAYKVRLTLTSDAQRTQKISADSQKLGELFTVLCSEVAVIERDIPPSAVADGNLIITIEKVSGPNAVVSLLEILAKDNFPLTRKRLTANEWLAKRLTEDDLHAVMPVLTPRPSDPDDILDLSGKWRFSTTAVDGFEKLTVLKGWSTIDVPGDWEMQRYVVSPNTYAGYFHTFNYKRAKNGDRIKLRFSAVYSTCIVYINGKEIGEHEGGFVPFEFDITDAIAEGMNTIALKVQNDSTLDILSSASKYADHPLGGITRKVQVFKVPAVHISDVKIRTIFDSTYQNATVTVTARIRNQSAKTLTGLTLKSSIAGLEKLALIKPVEPNQFETVVCLLQLKNPKKWTAETPDLYDLGLTLMKEDNELHEVKETVGIRQTEIRGNRVYLNGQPLKMRGVCRHEVHPLLGRSLNNELWEKDAKLFKEMNCNYIRTSHYPPAEEFIALCDRIGLYVELEAPLCWASNANSKKHFDLILNANLEAVQGYPNHASVILRSLANESGWNPNFDRVCQYMKLAVPGTPLTFHDWNNIANDKAPSTDIINHHYPKPEQVPETASLTRPVIYGEYCHINTYNRTEIFTDPGVRDYYGYAIGPMADTIYKADAVVGAAIWSGVDDLFLHPTRGPIGYGEWGPIDGWRRLKPEAWHVQKAYSPVRMTGFTHENNIVKVTLENRHDFTNIKDITIKANGKTIDAPAIPARGTGSFNFKVSKNTTSVKLDFFDRAKRLIDSENLILNKLEYEREMSDTSVALLSSPRFTAKSENGVITVAGNHFKWTISETCGQIISATINDKPVICGGPTLMLLPLTTRSGQIKPGETITALNEPCKEWKGKATLKSKTDIAAVITLQGAYTEGDFTCTLTIFASGKLKTDYDFKSAISMNPRQWGVVLNIPSSQKRIAWFRDTYWTAYPEGHLSMPFGTATAEIKKSDFKETYPKTTPSWRWEEDENSLGNVFWRSTRANIRWFRMDNPSTGYGIRIESEGKQGVRVWNATDDTFGMLVTGFNTGGGDHFLAKHYIHKPFKAGDTLSDTFTLKLVK